MNRTANRPTYDCLRTALVAALDTNNRDPATADTVACIRPALDGMHEEDRRLLRWWATGERLPLEAQRSRLGRLLEDLTAWFDLADQEDRIAWCGS